VRFTWILKQVFPECTFTVGMSKSYGNAMIV